MRFSTKRGRPAINRKKRDFGTKELQIKKSKGLTIEAIDVCYKKAIINDDQYKAAMHLRWLYTIKFGLPTTQAYDPAYLPGIVHIEEKKLNWMVERGKEYEYSIQCLKLVKADNIVTNIAIFNYYPSFLLAESANYQNYFKFLEGLSLLGGVDI